MLPPIRAVVVLGLLVAASACEQAKSSNPLSPLLAGPIAGVSITVPVLLEPEPQRAVAVENQPLRFLIENASSNGVRPVRYVFQVASDAMFNVLVHENTNITQGEGGRTSYTLPEPLAPERSYYWRVKADDGANASTFTTGRSFRVFTPVVINRPTLFSPANGATLTTRRPTLETNNASRTGPAGAITYYFQGSDTPVFAENAPTTAVPESSSGRTGFSVPEDLPYSVTFYWRVRAADPEHTGPWSETFSFKTPAAPPPPPPPPGGGGGTGPASGDQLDLSTVRWVMGVHVGNWAVTSTITGVTTNNETLCTNHTKAGQWPILGFFDIPGVVVEGSQIMIAKINNEWVGGGGEWLRPGQVCKHVGSNVGENVYYSSPPLQYWTPANGEQVGILVSTPSRVGQWGTAERSNVVLINWVK